MESPPTEWKGRASKDFQALQSELSGRRPRGHNFGIPLRSYSAVWVTGTELFVESILRYIGSGRESKNSAFIIRTTWRHKEFKLKKLDTGNKNIPDTKGTFATKPCFASL